MKLENLTPAKGATKNSKRIGRGEGSGKGGTATRGTKGAQARAGYEHKIGLQGRQRGCRPGCRRGALRLRDQY